LGEAFQPIRWFVEESKHYQRLLNERDHFEATFENASIGMAIVSLEGGWERINPALELFLERPKEEILNTTFQKLTYAPTLQRDLELVQECIDGKRSSYQLTKAYLMPDDRPKWGHLAVALVRKQGRPWHFISQITDIDELVRAKEALEAALLREKTRTDHLEREVSVLRNSGKGTLAEQLERALNNLRKP
jgi:PAS domain S-box-containing protein